MGKRTRKPKVEIPTCQTCHVPRAYAEDVLCRECMTPWPDRMAEHRADQALAGAAKMADERGMPEATVEAERAATTGTAEPERTDVPPHKAGQTPSLHVLLGPDAAAVFERASKFAPSKATMPVLTTLLVEGTANGTTVTATDLEVTYTERLSGRVLVEGAAAVNAKAAAAALKRARRATALLGFLDGWTEIHGDPHVTLPGHESGDYPTHEPFEVEAVPRDLTRLLAALDAVSHAMSTDETRYHLNGVAIEYQPKLERLMLVATDGHRIALADVPLQGRAPSWPAPVGDHHPPIMPRVALPHVIRHLREWAKRPLDAASFHVGKRGWLLRIGNRSIQGQWIDGEFPDYRRVLPKESAIQVIAERKDLLDAIRSLGPWPTIRLDVRVGAVDLLGSHPDRGEARTRVSAHTLGGGLTTGFNPRYLAEVLTAARGTTVRITATDALNAIRVQGEGVEAVVMPCRV